MRVVPDDDYGIAGDGDECFELLVGAAVLDHDGPGQGAPQGGVGREPGPHTHLFLRGEQS